VNRPEPRPARLLPAIAALVLAAATGQPRAAEEASGEAAGRPAGDATSPAASAGAADAGGAGPPGEAPLEWAQVGRDARYVYTRPLHLDRAGWSKVAWTLGAAGAAYLVRDEVREAVQRNRTEDLDRFLGAVRTMGKGVSVGAAALGFYISGTRRDSGYQRETALLLVESLTFALPIAGVSGRVLATERPFKGDSVQFLQGEGHSVSGDVTIATSLLAPIIDRHLRADADDTPRIRSWKRFGTWSLYGAAGVVALQRMNNDRHYLPDVILGYANGLTVGRLLVDARRGGPGWRRAGRPGRMRRVALEPIAGGLRIVWP
jgi:hypothetical protein